MEVKNILLLADAEDPTAAEPMVVHLDADATCLLLSVGMGEKKADVFLWRESDGSAWGRITTAEDNRLDRLGEEKNLFAEGAPNAAAQTSEAIPDSVQEAAPIAETAQEDEFPLPPVEEVRENEEVIF
jgi:hypothetical protein